MIIKYIPFLLCYVIFGSTFPLCENKQLDLRVDVLVPKVTPFEPVVLNIKLINKSNRNARLYRFSPNKSIKIGIRKLGDKDWKEVGVFDFYGRFQFPLDDYVKTIELTAKDTMDTTIGIIPWDDDGGRTEKRYYSPYQGDGDYELKLTYNLSPHNEMTSKVFKFEVNSKYNGYGGEVIKYLEGLKIPHFMYDAFTYGYYLKPNKEFSASTHSEYILSNFGKSVYAAWTKLYLIESGQYQDSKRELKELLEYPNPLIKERAKLLLEHVKN